MIVITLERAKLKEYKINRYGSAVAVFVTKKRVRIAQNITLSRFLLNILPKFHTRRLRIRRRGVFCNIAPCAR